MERNEVGRRPVNNRAKVTNGSCLLAGIDGRSAEARRYRDLCFALADDLGGQDKLTEAQRALVRQAAANVVASEKLQASIIRGEDIDLEQATRLANVAARSVNRLVALRKPRKAISPLAEHFSRPHVRGGGA